MRPIHTRGDCIKIAAERDRLANSGALVPVKEGDECSYGDWLEQQSSTAFISNGKVNVHVIVNRYQSANGGPSCHIDADTSVQPVEPSADSCSFESTVKLVGVPEASPHLWCSTADRKP